MPRKPAAKKTATKKAPSKKAPAKAKPSTVDEARLDADFEGAADLVTLVNDAIKSATPGEGKIQAEAINAAALLDCLKTRIESTLKGFKAVALAHQAEGGLFEAHGRYTLELKEGSSRRPSWKDEAVGQAKIVADLKGTSFNEDVYTAQVAAATEPKISVSLKFNPRDDRLED